MKYRHPDTWYQKAAHSLASGARQEDVAKECGIGVRTLKRHLGAPGSTLVAMVAQERVQLAATTADQRGGLLDKALDVLSKNLDADGKLSLDAAKAVIGKLLPTQISTQVEESKPEPEILPVDACKEVALSLPAFADLARLGQLPLEAVEELREACRAFLADDLKPRPPIDLEADRVEMVGSEEVSSDADGAGMIPVRH